MAVNDFKENYLFSKITTKHRWKAMNVWDCHCVDCLALRPRNVVKRFYFSQHLLKDQPVKFGREWYLYHHIMMLSTQQLFHRIFIESQFPWAAFWAFFPYMALTFTFFIASLLSQVSHLQTSEIGYLCSDWKNIYKFKIAYVYDLFWWTGITQHFLNVHNVIFFKILLSKTLLFTYPEEYFSLYFIIHV